MQRLRVPMTIVLLAGCTVPRPDDMAPLPCRDRDDDASARCALRTGLAHLESTQLSQDITRGEPRLAGEWPSWVRGGVFASSELDAFYDSNAFIPLLVAQSLGALDDAQLPTEARRVTAMRTRVRELVLRHYADARGEVNFWPRLDGFHGPQQLAYRSAWVRLFPGPMLDIANDADDTALAHALIGDDVLGTEPLETLLDPWRDLSRRRTDARGVQGTNTGAFLTWLSDEGEPRNRQPATPLLPNNVDCVVQANVLLALATNERTAAGADDACAVVRASVTRGRWPTCSLYYPARWSLPLATLRAAHAGASCLDDDESLRAIAAALVAHQADEGWFGDVANPAPDEDAREPGFRGDARVLSTAQATVTALLLGGMRPSQRAEMRAVAQRGLHWLWDHAWHDGGDIGWRGGTVFSSSFAGLASWRSPAAVTALVVEASAWWLATPGNRSGPRHVLGTPDVPGSWVTP